MSNIIRGYIDHMKFCCLYGFLVISFLHVLLVLLYHCVYGCVFCVLLFDSVSYIFLFLCMLCSS